MESNRGDVTQLLDQYRQGDSDAEAELFRRVYSDCTVWRRTIFGVSGATTILFAMIVLHKLCDRASEVPLPQRNYSTETFFLDRPNESLGVSIAFGARTGVRTTRMPNVAKPLSHGAAPFPIPIADEHTMADQHPSSVAVTRRTIWPMNKSPGWDVEPSTWTRREARSMTNTV